MNIVNAITSKIGAQFDKFSHNSVVNEQPRDMIPAYPTGFILQSCCGKSVKVLRGTPKQFTRWVAYDLNAKTAIREHALVHLSDGTMVVACEKIVTPTELVLVLIASRVVNGSVTVSSCAIIS